MQNYTVNWSEKLIAATEKNLQLVHGSIKKYLKRLPSTSVDAAGAIDPCGSFLLRTNVHKSPYHCTTRLDGMLGADMCVTMPTSVCSLDDVQEGRYLECREAFLQKLLAFLEDDLKKSTDATCSLAMKPFLNDSMKHVIRIAVSTPEGNQDESTEPLSVDVHCRPSVVGARVASEKSIEKHPLYSHLVLEDFLMLDHLKRFHQACLASQNVLRAVVFLKAWAAHYGLIGSTFPGALNGFVVTALVVKMLEDGIITASLSEENIIRSVWVQLSRSAFMSSASRPVLKFAGESHNVLFRVSAEFMQDIVRRTAEESLRAKVSADTFHTRHSPLELRYNVALTLHGLGNVPLDISSAVKTSSCKQFASELSARRVAELVEKAMGPRKLKNLLVWVGDSGDGTLLIDVMNEVEARSRLIVGPTIEDGEGVGKFDAFWGVEMTSTRQFPDGSIHRCVALNSGNASTISSSAVLQHAIRFVLRKHISEAAVANALLGSMETLVYENVGGEFLDAVPLTETHLRQSAAAVVAMINRLPSGSVPCKIASIDMISPSLRGCDPFAGRPNVVLTKTTDIIPPCLATVPTIEPINCVLGIDDKHKIPDTLEAIAMMKGAICAQITKALRAANPSVVVMCTSQTIDIILNGYLFRIYVAHYREVSLLRALQRDADAAFLERKLFWTARHTTFINAIAFGHYSFGMAVRLARRWVAAMYLGEFIAAEAIELLVADAYLQDHAPKSASCGFVSFLQLLAHHDWTMPLILPTVTLTEVKLEERTKDCAMWIVAPYATTLSPFTLSTPRSMIVHRLASLARSALRTVSLLVSASNPQLEASLFTIDESEFDVVIPIARDLQLVADRNLFSPALPCNAVKRYWRQDELSETEYVNYVHHLVEMEPVNHCLKTIRMRTRDRCMVFADILGPSNVACIMLSSAPSTAQCHQLESDIATIVRGAFTATTAKAKPNRKAVKAPSSKKDAPHHKKKARMEQ